MAAAADGGEYSEKKIEADVSKQSLSLIGNDGDTQQGPSLLQTYLQQTRRLGVEPKSSVLRVFNEKYGGTVEELNFSGLMVLSGVSVQDILSVVMECHCPALRVLDLSNNNISSEEVPYISHVCKALPSLTTLNLNNNPTLGYAAAKFLLDLVKRQRSITSLEVENTAIVQSTKNLIRTYLKQNNSNKLPPIAAPPTASIGLHTSWIPSSLGDTLAGQLHSPTKIPTPPTERRNFVPANRQLRSEMHKPLASTPRPISKYTNPDAQPLTRDIHLISELTKEDAVVRDIWMNLEERITGLHEAITEQGKANRHDLHSKHQKSLNTAFDYIESCSFPSTYSVLQLMQEAVTNSSFADLTAPVDKYQPHKPLGHMAIQRVLGHLLQSTPSDAGEALSRELDGLLSEHKLNYLPDYAIPLHKMLHSPILDVTYLKAELRKTEAKMKNLVFRIDNSDMNKEHSVQDEDIAAAEKYNDESIELSEELLQIIQDRLEALEWKGGQKPFLEDLESFLKMSVDRMNQEKALHAELLDKLNATLRSLDFKREKEEIQNSQRLWDFNQFKKNMLEDLHTNERRQNKCWDIIIEHFEELKRLGAERTRMNKVLLDEGEKEGHRKSDYSKFLDVFNKHNESITNLKNQVKSYIDVIDKFLDFTSDVEKGVQDKVEKLNKEADALILEEQRNYHAMFKRTYLNIGELLFRKEKQMEEMDRVLRGNEYQLSQCKETFDPWVKKYKNRSTKLERQREEVARKIELLRQRADKAAEDFEATQDVLEHLGYEDPTVELQELNVERRGMANQKLEKLVDRDKDAALAEKLNIDVLQKAAKQAKEQGLRSLVSPSRPTKTKGGRYVLLNA
eukprot:TRINITY_DN52009_c0_g1_i1.p1 TRINITY_DN52009_c0_g1~~TRINITY_DN52009_c0_g1_i1.p1  ORF type:complete len:850 (+),score=104.95 TRINITY_DN52009_c0_g1_i1:68-2617(+)